MTTTPTNTGAELTVTLAASRLGGTADQAEAPAVARSLMRGNATQDERQAHLYAALRAAGMVGDVIPEPFVTPDGVPAPLPRVTPERLRFVDSIVRGESRAEAAARIICSPETLRRHAGIMYRQWGVNSAVELVVALVRFGVIESPLRDEAPEGVEVEAHRVEARGARWAVISPSGEVVSRHRTEAAALARCEVEDA